MTDHSAKAAGAAVGIVKSFVPTPVLARQLGIAVVAQEPQMAPALSVADNILGGGSSCV